MVGPKNLSKIAPYLPYDTCDNNLLVYYNFDQYLYRKKDDPTQGIGLFGRFGWVPQDINAITHFYSAGVGGRGLVPHRGRDTYGVGYYYCDLSKDLPPTMSCEQGIEAYYNIEITSWLHVSPDMQVIVNPGGGFYDYETSIVYGMRMQMDL